MMMQQRPFTLALSWIGFLITLLFAVSMRAELAHQPVRVGPEFQVNTFTADNQLDPAVAMDDAGNFVVTWYSVGQNGSTASVFAQRFDAQGTPLGREFQVNDYHVGGQQHPAMAMNGAGHFVIVWRSMNQDGSQFGIFAQRFDPQGKRLGNEFQVNTFTAGNQIGPVAAMDAAGNFVISWSSWGQDGDAMGVFAQRFDAEGARVGPEFQVNTARAGSQLGSAVSMDSAGNFVVSWSSGDQDDSNWDVYGQRFDAQGTPLGREFQVNTHTSNSQQFQASEMDQARHVVIAWCSREQDGDRMGIFAQRFDATGAPLGDEFQVNSFVTSEQAFPSMAMNETGHFVVAWHSQSQDGSGFGIFAQRFQLRALGEDANGLATEGSR